MLTGGVIAAIMAAVPRMFAQAAVLLPAPYRSSKYVAPPDAGWDIIVAGRDEPGDRFVVTGRALDDGAPVANVSIYVFHVDAEGFYSRDGLNSDENARLFGTLRTDQRGRYRYETIRPSGYGELSAHVHQVINASGYKPRLFDLWLGDDPILARNRASGRNLPPAEWIRAVTRDTNGVWHAEHDVEMIRDSN
ncbi:MAG: hypothetical protein HOP14_12790 [Acidobacteria bacterium]|nr:hypothetical protein [Acidobacteriota bacterium]